MGRTRAGRLPPVGRATRSATRCRPRPSKPVRRGTLDYFFAYPEDYAQHRVEWVDGQFGQRPHHPAFEVIYVYSQVDGTLDVNIRGARPAVEPLQGLFAATILKQPALPPIRPTTGSMTCMRYGSPGSSSSMTAAAAFRTSR